MDTLISNVLFADTKVKFHIITQYQNSVMLRQAISPIKMLHNIKQVQAVLTQACKHVHVYMTCT